MESENPRLDVLLINPPYSRLKGIYSVHFPIGIGYLAGALRKHCNVMIYNMEDPLSEREEFRLKSDKSSFKLCYSRLFSQSDNYRRSLESNSLPVWQEAKEVFLKFKPKIIGITCKSAEYHSALKVAEIYKALFSQGIVILGGQHPTIQSEEIILSDIARRKSAGKGIIDILVRGEGEKTAAELISVILNKGIDFSAISQIPGLSFYNGAQISHTANRPLLLDLDAMEFPARDLLIKPIRERNAYGEIIASRGCPFDCGFCSARAIWDKKVRYRSVQNVAQEIEQVIRQYKAKRFNFRDDTFALNRQWAIRLLAALRKLKIEWECTSRVDAVDYDLLREMRSAGCFAISYGIESGSEPVLKKICKNITLKQINKANSETIRAGIIPKGFLMVGFPDEAEEDILATIKFVKKTKFLDLGLSVFTPYPGSRLFERARQLGLLRKDISWDKTSHLSLNNFFTQCVTKERFISLLQELICAVDRHNASLRLVLVKIKILIRNSPSAFFKRIFYKLKNAITKTFTAKEAKCAALR